MQSFIVRIYRTAGEDQRRIVGVVEKPGVEGKQAFTQYDELWDILSRQAGKGRGNTGKAVRKIKNNEAR